MTELHFRKGAATGIWQDILADGYSPFEVGMPLEINLPQSSDLTRALA